MVLLTEHFPMLRAPVPFITDHGTSPRPKTRRVGPRVDKPHLASIARIRPAVAGRALKDVAKVRERNEGKRERVGPGQRERLTSNDPALQGIGPEDSQSADGAHTARTAGSQDSGGPRIMIAGPPCIFRSKALNLMNDCPPILQIGGLIG
jgi:hypothetical protein